MNEKCIRGDCVICGADGIPVYELRPDPSPELRPVQRGTDYVDSLSDKSLIPF